jgi:hypothetical protein
MIRKLLVLLGVAFFLRAASADATPCAGFTDLDSASPFCDEVQWIKNRASRSGVLPRSTVPTWT